MEYVNFFVMSGKTGVHSSRYGNQAGARNLWLALENEL